MTQQRDDVVRVVVVGHVDHGKSTLIGRLLYDTGNLSDKKVAELKASSERRGMPMEWGFAMDALQAERDQAITIDTSTIWFRAGGRSCCIIDAPGHREFIKNMVTGASEADAALVVIDASEGVRDESRRHGCLLSLLGVRQIGVVVNKMDLVDHSQEKYQEVVDEYRAYLRALGVEPAFFAPVVARDGSNVAERAEALSWYEGPTVLDALLGFTSARPPVERSLRLPIQGVYKFDERRLLAGRIESGVLRVGDRVIFKPSNKSSSVRSIERFNAPESDHAVAGESTTITLDEQIFVERGQILSRFDDPPFETNIFRARLFWLGRRDLEVGRRYKIKVAAQGGLCWVDRVERVIDANTLDSSADGRDVVHRNEVAEVTIRTRHPVALDSFEDIPETGRFVLVDEGELAGGGIIDLGDHAARDDRARIRSGNIFWSESQVTRDERVRRNGHEGAVIWLTGFSGAGKSTIAQQLERQLFAHDFHTYVLDGDNVRHGLNRNLGFSKEDRAENIRRIGEVAKLMADAGLIAVTAFISPYRTDRQIVRSLLDVNEFVEVYVECPIEVCEERDPKHLYKRARAGEIRGFTGIDDPYEVPESPEVVVRTHEQTVEECVDTILGYLEKRGILRR